MALIQETALTNAGVGATRVVADWVAQMRYTDLGPAVVREATLAIADGVGVIFGGLQEPVSETMFGWVSEQGGAQCASIFGRGVKTSSSLAALANGVTGHALDYGSINLTLAGFITMPFLPAVLALGEAHHRSGADVLTAFVVGTEIAAKLGRGLNMLHYEKGWHPTATLGTFGAAAAAANLLGLTPEQTLHTLGVAGSEAAGLKCNIGTMVLPYHTGKAARNGVVAAEMAARGFTASQEVLESVYGFCELFNGAGQYDLAQVTDHLGQPFDIVDPGVLHKYYPCCGLVHSALDAIDSLRAAQPFDPQDVAEIDAALHYLVPRVMRYDEPRSGYEAKFSLPYCLASGVAYGAPMLDRFTDASLTDPLVRRLMGRVAYRVHPDLESRESIDQEFSEVTLRLRNGRELVERVARKANKGSPRRPLTDDELRRKFWTCTQGALSAEEADRLWQRLRGFGQEADVADLATALRGAG